MKEVILFKPVEKICQNGDLYRYHVVESPPSFPVDDFNEPIKCDVKDYTVHVHTACQMEAGIRTEKRFAIMDPMVDELFCNQKAELEQLRSCKGSLEWQISSQRKTFHRLRAKYDVLLTILEMPLWKRIFRWKTAQELFSE